MRQTSLLPSCVGFLPTGCPLSACVHCLCSILGRDPSSIVQILFLCSHSLMVSPLIQRETPSLWMGCRSSGLPFSCLISLASSFMVHQPPECCGHVFSSSFLTPLSGMLVLRSLHGLSPHLLQVFGHMSPSSLNPIFLKMS